MPRGSLRNVEEDPEQVSIFEQQVDYRAYTVMTPPPPVMTPPPVPVMTPPSTAPPDDQNQVTLGAQRAQPSGEDSEDYVINTGGATRPAAPVENMTVIADTELLRDADSVSFIYICSIQCLV